MKFSVLTLLLMAFLSSCASHEKVVRHERLVSRMDGLSERPAWVMEHKPISIQKDKIVALGTSALTDEHRMEVAFRIAERNGKHLLQENLETKMKSIYQGLAKSTAKEQKHFMDIQKDLLRSIMDLAKVGGKYWEKVQVSEGDQVKANENKVYVSIETSKDQFLKKVEQVFSKAQSKKQLSKNSALQIKSEWKKFISGL